MRTFSAIIFCFFISLNSVIAEQIKLADLGKLKVVFSKIDKVEHVPSSKILVEVSVKEGDAFVLTTPTNIQQIRYLLVDGEPVKKGQPYATLLGPEVHHFLSEFEATKTLYEISKSRLENSRSLFNKKLIKEEKWLEINKYYYAIYLEYEHMRHFYDLINSVNEDDDSITIEAPIDGVFNRPSIGKKYSEGDVIARFIPQESIRLNLKLAPNQAASLDHVSLPNCRVDIATISKVAVNAFVDVWSEPIDQSCQLVFGQAELAVPFYKRDAYKVSKNAIFILDGIDHILVKRGAVLEAVRVSLMTSEGHNYLLTSETELTNSEVLISSVSAVQGILLGLGGE